MNKKMNKLKTSQERALPSDIPTNNLYCTQKMILNVTIQNKMISLKYQN